MIRSFDLHTCHDEGGDGGGDVDEKTTTTTTTTTTTHYSITLFMRPFLGFSHF